MTDKIREAFEKWDSEQNNRTRPISHFNNSATYEVWQAAWSTLTQSMTEMDEEYEVVMEENRMLEEECERLNAKLETIRAQARREALEEAATLADKRADSLLDNASKQANSEKMKQLEHTSQGAHMVFLEIRKLIEKEG